MRPETLRISAFGAFAGEQVLDFAAFGPHRLFLIHGPIGAGKTTLLDAVCFALFGESSGDERKAADLRSHHADSGTPTYVELDFALGADRFRIRRMPAQTGLGVRGKEIKRNPQVTLWRRIPDGALELLAEQERPVRDRIAQLLGYSAAEFRQVVLLPQGQFRELLVAPPDERQRILATLFRTALYRRVQESLQEMERAARAEAATSETRRRTLLDEASAETPQAAAEAVSALRQEAVTAQDASTAAATAAGAAEQALNAARQDAERLQAARGAGERLATLEAAQPVMRANQDLLESARRAQGLAGEDATARSAADTAARAASEKRGADEAMANAECRIAAARQALADAEVREARAQDAVAEATRLEALASQAGLLAESAEAMIRAEAALAQADGEFRSATEERDAAVGAVVAATSTHQAASALADRVHDRSARLATAKMHAIDVAAHAKACHDVTQAQEAVAMASATVENAAAALAAARAERVEAERIAWAHAAADLATQLEEGEACPVCGSHDHPMPAHPPLEYDISLDQVRANEAKCDEEERAASGVLVHATAALQSATLFRDGLAARLAGNVLETLPDIEVTNARAALAESEEAAAQLSELADRLRLAEATLRSAEDRLFVIGEKVTVARELATRTAAVHETRLANVPEEARNPAALANAIKAAKSVAAAVRATLDRDRAEEAASGAALIAAREAALKASERAQEASEAAATADTQFLTALHARGFSDREDYQMARRHIAKIDELAGELKTYDADLAIAREVQRLASEAARGVSPPDVPALEARAQACLVEARDASTAEGMALQRLDAAAGRLERILEADAGFIRAREQHALMQNLSRQATGLNSLRLSFEGFVLASLLDEALAAANDHLLLMLDGRYRLRRREEPGKANAAVGLDVEVLDEWTGQARAAGTLSGGEGFCAALAMALGLAETVQAHAGARPLDTLLIDEGFGSLDENALEKAMEVLARLEGKNRLVGIISHVGELRSRIPARLEVTSGMRGSSARMVAV